jgi:tetratricopeptide (TPR) repeat protein
MAASYHQLGILAQDRGDYAEAARQYQRSLDIEERLGNLADMAASYHQLGILAQRRGDYAEAARQYQRSLDINERLDDQVSTATTCSQLGILEAERGGPPAAAIAWHTRALAIRLNLRLPRAVNNLRGLAALRSELAPEAFASVLSQAAGDTDLAEAITSLLDHLNEADSSSGP